ncbi:ISAzo13 family transposase, partial [Intrasporangium sp.]|uniref:ISAzo13 family transposase n=1 Tax=Intrasporangium sp. TaxID=1925024 RepID=UPI0039C88018
MRAKFAAVLPHLDERGQRLVLGAEARALGHGGIGAVARASGTSRSRISARVAELESGREPLRRVRREGGGRKPAEQADAGLVAATGHRVSHETVAKLLHAQGFSLQANAKTIEGGQPPDRDAQFDYLNEQAKSHLGADQPVISVDTKKKELVGPYKNRASEWRPAGDPEQVKVHDFIDPALGKANPYGVYDLTADTGWVSVGTDHDTAAFAVNTIRSWWQAVGAERYPDATRLMISADG